MATVTKRGKYWCAQIRRLGFPPQHKSFDTHAEAEAWARAAESEMDRGIAEFVAALDAYIRWYNETRIKISLGGISPAAHRRSLGFAV